MVTSILSRSFLSLSILFGLQTLSDNLMASGNQPKPQWEKDLERDRTSPFTRQQTWDIIKEWGGTPSGPRPKSPPKSDKK